VAGGKLSHLYANRVLILREPERLERGERRPARARVAGQAPKPGRPAEPGSAPSKGGHARLQAARPGDAAQGSARRPSSGSRSFPVRTSLHPHAPGDSVKRVPVQAGPGVTLRQCLPALPRPLSLLVSTPAGVEKREAVIVLNRRGIARIVRRRPPAVRPAEVELPDLADDGAELVPQPDGLRARAPCGQRRDVLKHVALVALLEAMLRDPRAADLRRDATPATGYTPRGRRQWGDGCPVESGRGQTHSSGDTRRSSVRCPGPSRISGVPEKSFAAPLSARALLRPQDRMLLHEIESRSAGLLGASVSRGGRARRRRARGAPPLLCACADCPL